MLLEAEEKAIADLGYRGEPDTIDLPEDGPIETHRPKAVARLRHETCNRRFKQWACMNVRFRHSMVHHGECMKAIAVLTQLAIENGEPLFNT